MNLAENSVTNGGDTEKEDDELSGHKMDEDFQDFDEQSSSEQELTNLGWLIDLKNLTNWSSQSASSRKKSMGTFNVNSDGIIKCIIDDIDDDDGCLEPIITDRDLSEERFKKFTIQVKQ